MPIRNYLLRAFDCCSVCVFCLDVLGFVVCFNFLSIWLLAVNVWSHRQAALTVCV